MSVYFYSFWKNEELIDAIEHKNRSGQNEIFKIGDYVTLTTTNGINELLFHIFGKNRFKIIKIIKVKWAWMPSDQHLIVEGINYIWFNTIFNKA